MATVKTNLNMNGAGFLSSDVLKKLNELSAMLLQVSATLNVPLLEVARQTQEISRILSPAIQQWAEISARLANLMTPAIIAAAEMAARTQIELSPLLRELHDVSPSGDQLSGLFEKVSLYADEMTFDVATDEIDSLTAPEKQETVKAVSEILAEPDNWEQTLVKSLRLAQERHPVFAKAIIWLLSAIITIVLNVAANTIYDTIKIAKLREKPAQDATVVTIVNISQEVTIINDVPYYFEIEYIDTVTEKRNTGWISKRSVQEHQREAH